MPIEIGVAMSSAMNDAHTVPKASGPTYSQKERPSRMWLSLVSGANAGTLCITRKAATAASTTRMMIPAPRALPENTRSPRRCLALIGAGGACLVVVLMVSVRVEVRLWADPPVPPRRIGRGGTGVS